MPGPFLVLNENTKRESGSKVHRANIQASKAVADIIRTTLGPRSMLKMLLDASGGIVITNDGNAILRELDVAHPAAKMMLDLSRTQDEEVGDGTTSVIILAGEMLYAAEPFLEKQFHPTVICRAFTKALEDALAALEECAFPIDVDDREQLLSIVRSCIGTKFTSRFGTLIADLAIDSVKTVAVDLGNGSGRLQGSQGGHVQQGRCGSWQDIANPRIILLDCPLEYKKGENMTNAELMNEDDWTTLLKMEEDYIQEMCTHILKLKPDVVITEKGLSDLASHYLSKAGVSAIRRIRKTDNNRIARACGATIVYRPEELQESDVGTGAGLFEVQKIGDEFFTFVIACKDPKACTILLRGASKDILNEVERNLHDAMGVARNVIRDGKLVPGGGAAEMAVSAALKRKASSIEGSCTGFRRDPSNAGVNVIRTMTALQARHADGKEVNIGIEGHSGKITDMKEAGVWDSFGVKEQTFKTAIEAACMLRKLYHLQLLHPEYD